MKDKVEQYCKENKGITILYLRGKLWNLQAFTIGC